MADPSELERLRSYDPSDAEHVSRLTNIVGVATRSDGQPPFSDQSLVELRDGRRAGLVATVDSAISAVAITTTSGSPREAELVVHPAARHRGLGGLLLEGALAASFGSLLVWAHGDHPDARALALRHGMVAVRELLQLRLEPVHSAGEAAAVTAFRPGTDDADWLALNALAFADHPEQGSLTQDDLDARMSEEWFDPEDFLVTRSPDGAMTGFCWLKVDRALPAETGLTAEFYAVAVAPAAQGTGLGRRLVNAGLARIESRGIRTANLYVEGENASAVGLYRSVGFVDHSIDVQYATSAH